MDDNKNSTRSRLKYRYDFQDTHRQNDANEAHHTINKSQTSEAKKKNHLNDDAKPRLQIKSNIYTCFYGYVMYLAVCAIHNVYIHRRFDSELIVAVCLRLDFVYGI